MAAVGFSGTPFAEARASMNSFWNPAGSTAVQTFTLGVRPRRLSRSQTVMPRVSGEAVSTPTKQSTVV